jgi:hypothetical protein
MPFARSDVVSVAIPETAGGCGASHSRPVTNGAPEEVWQLTCPACSVYLTKDPLWSSTEAEIPETYDEQRIREDNEKRGNKAREKSQQELSGRLVDVMERLESRQTSDSGVDPQLIARLVEEQVTKILAAQANSVPEPELEPVLDYDKLHWKTLQKICREKNLPDTGGRDELAARLKAAV